ncbi:YbdK family carboxylate-amine ligase [Bordetella avium]|uniref:Putative glutamate--cysteine ligase 2 n=1 Tax=Bordetella avium (strain 197N) TaxID=360910 RepID=GCS2_BORA1|nr:YbdK family carboxylate-amine ligase [Bordetella avium]Q2L0C4.1 RecName: Full=Putative glutamate--cysteine ligase 2; AltName: Full=Gamma-glutamylcysteine synthetase 2; Short=GCS 2; Short=Gamma-GCS 2 [Bordetella avium 197N]AZY47905.1 glutamate--cysteine ligase [Bordetella avium]AZY51277.1 glutamate--cysteine ligase [Bordetella avium]RIQ18641.1 glutamate--cysteine ligase [Bordetella avium]RIQ35323.1 glutamate--cysteine ligase [Bordetella avium]RIQ53723.1 glutamate--cysteine ligase [Bordetell
MEQIPFVSSSPNTLGIELELQLIDPAGFDLAAASDELLAQLANHPVADRIKPEITRSMIELNSSVHEHPAGLLAEMREMRDALCEAADAVGVSVSGGGTHPFMRWQERTISDTPRFQYLAEMYGYLARQFTVFGQHIHLGVPSGDAAVRLVHGLSPYVPHFIALSASSPYREGVDTLFSCARLNAVNSFPLAGHLPPEVADWYHFEAHIAQLRASGLAESIKDLYWDIRPKPEFGTVEIRVCDTPLTVERACQLAAFAQALAVLLEREPSPPTQAWLAYRSNHFQACRFGLHGSYVTPGGQRVRLADHLKALFVRLMPVAEELGTTDILQSLRDEMQRGGNDARWLRAQFHRTRELSGTVEAMTQVFRGESAAQRRAPQAARRRIRASSEPLGPMSMWPERLH